MADRQARAALASSLGKGSDILKDLFSGQFKLLEQNNAIEAEFYDEPEEPEE
jgi:fructose 1,6-bisphosphatase